MVSSLFNVLKRTIQLFYNKVHVFRYRQYYSAKITSITKAIGSVKKIDSTEHIKLWKRLVKRVNPLWLDVYSSVSGIIDHRYVPEDLYYTVVEPCLNDNDVTLFYNDKNLYDKFYDNVRFPLTILRNMDGSFYDRDYNKLSNHSAYTLLKDALETYRDIVVKPSRITGGGRELRLFRADDKPVTTEILNKLYSKDYIVQKRMLQGEYYREFNPSSFNGFRVYTYRSVTTDEIFIDNILLKIGGKNKLADNTNAGGMYINVFPDGKLGEYAVDHEGIKIFHPAGTRKEFRQFASVPHVKEIHSISIEIAKQCLSHHILGLDIGMENDGKATVIDINFRSIGIGCQMLNGSLFKDHTEEVVDYCEQKIKSINFPLQYV